jgi:hypothetical protein
MGFVKETGKEAGPHVDLAPVRSYAKPGMEHQWEVTQKLARMTQTIDLLRH